MLRLLDYSNEGVDILLLMQNKGKICLHPSDLVLLQNRHRCREMGLASVAFPLLYLVR